MYYAHFGLKEPPFKITPNTDFFFSGSNRGAVLDALVYAITTGEGIVKVVGEVGSGKTMLCRMLETLLPQNVESVYLANPSVAPEDVLHAIAFELHLDLPPEADRLQVMHALQAHLLERHAENRRVVIFIEEAQGMPLATLEEIRLLTNLETRHDKLLQIVLFGQPELDENLNAQHIRQLRERITHSFNLGPLEAEEIGEYLIFRLRTAGYFGPQLFTKGAIKRIAAASEGLVRRVNILADKALLAAFAENGYAVERKHVDIAVKDSEFGAERGRPVGRGKWIGFGLAMITALAAGFGLHALMPSAAKPDERPVSAAPQAAAPAPATVEASVAMEAAAQGGQAPVSAQLPASPSAPQAGSVAPPPSQMSSAAVDILEQRLQRTQEWLASQPATTVTIQLMGWSGEPEQLKQTLKTLGATLEMDNLRVFRTQSGGKPSTTVVYGEYQNREAARVAMQSLPKSLLARQPQLRTVGGIREEIKLSQ